MGIVFRRLVVGALFTGLGLPRITLGTLTNNVDLDRGPTYSGTSVAPDSGTTWNCISGGVVTSGNAELTIPVQPVSLTSSLANEGLTLTWPTTQKGYRLQSQTNPPGVGLTTNQLTVSGSANICQTNVTIGATVGSVFFIA